VAQFHYPAVNGQRGHTDRILEEQKERRQIMDDLQRLRQSPLPFATLLGIHFTSAAPERVTAELVVRDDLCTRPAILHGGAIMAFADTLGAAATILNLPAGTGRPAPAPRPSNRKPISWLRRRLAPKSWPRPRPSIADAAPWSGKPASPTRPAALSRWSHRRN
jgi:hypothetical protein